EHLPAGRSRPRTHPRRDRFARHRHADPGGGLVQAERDQAFGGPGQGPAEESVREGARTKAEVAREKKEGNIGTGRTLHATSSFVPFALPVGVRDEQRVLISRSLSIFAPP